MEIYLTISLISLISLFSCFQLHFIIDIDCTRIPASNTTSDDVTN